MGKKARFEGLSGKKLATDGSGMWSGDKVKKSAAKICLKMVLFRAFQCN
jgi:hypothetical protein